MVKTGRSAPMLRAVCRVQARAGMTTQRRPLVQAEALTRRFGDLVANDAVDLTVYPGEIHALLGENGAGKSTLVKMLYGLLAPDEGRILWEGAPVALPDPTAARALGIGMVFQHFSLFDALSVAENVALALDDDAPLAQVAERLREVSRAYGLPLEPDRGVWRLSVGERQRIEIVRCLMQDPRLLILDEPTSVLTPQECDGLFDTLRTLRDEGRAVLYISHKLDEVRALCEAATILRAGRVVERCDPRTQSSASLARMMVGTQISDVRRSAMRDVSGPVRLRVSNLDLPSEDPQGTSLKGVNLELHAGEILGIAGSPATGRTSCSPRSRARPRPRAPTRWCSMVRPWGTKASTAAAAGRPPSCPRNGSATPPRRACRCRKTRWWRGMRPTGSCAAG